MKATTISDTRLKLECPTCHTLTFDVSHVIGSKASTFQWYCEACGTQAHIGYDGAQDFDVEAGDTTLIKMWSLLRLDVDATLPIYVIYEGGSLPAKIGQPLDMIQVNTDQEFLFNEHACPFNWLGATTIAGTDTDKHGLFRHVETILAPTQEQLRAMIESYGVANMHSGKLYLSVPISLTANDLPYSALCKLFAALPHEEPDPEVPPLSI